MSVATCLLLGDADSISADSASPMTLQVTLREISGLSDRAMPGNRLHVRRRLCDDRQIAESVVYGIQSHRKVGHHPFDKRV
jgi:hypothetical protein